VVAKFGCACIGPGDAGEVVRRLRRDHLVVEASAFAVDDDDLGCMREVEPVGHVSDTDLTRLDTAVTPTGVLGGGAERLVIDRFARGEHARLVVLDLEQVVRTLDLHEPGRVGTVGVHCIRGHQRTLKVQALEQRPERGDLVGFRVYFLLSDHDPCAVDHRGEQVHLSAVFS